MTGKYWEKSKAVPSGRAPMTRPPGRGCGKSVTRWLRRERQQAKAGSGRDRHRSYWRFQHEQSKSIARVAAAQKAWCEGSCSGWAGIVTGLVILSMLGAVFESASEAADARAYPPPGHWWMWAAIACTSTVWARAAHRRDRRRLGRLVDDVGFCANRGAKTTRVCTYDRAGSGWSDSGPLPRDAGQFANELHTLLQKANLPGPFVLVGHSLGGLPVRVFTGEYPAEVAGVVLIDSMFPGQGGHPSADANTQVRGQTRAFSLLPLLARFGGVRVLSKLLGAANSTPAERTSFGYSVSPKYVQAAIDELSGIPDSLAQAEAVKSFGEIPLIVLTRGLDQDPGWLVRPGCYNCQPIANSCLQSRAITILN